MIVSRSLRASSVDIHTQSLALTLYRTVPEDRNRIRIRIKSGQDRDRDQDQDQDQDKQEQCNIYLCITHNPILHHHSPPTHLSSTTLPFLPMTIHILSSVAPFPP